MGCLTKHNIGSLLQINGFHRDQLLAVHLRESIATAIVGKAWPLL
jgi:hypothetical protein